MNVLILGGTTEASDLARALADDPAIRAVLSLAGRTRAPVLPAVAARRGGFGGVDGLACYLRDHAVDALVDATHPFAAQMSRHAPSSSRWPTSPASSPPSRRSSPSTRCPSRRSGRPAAAPTRSSSS